MDVQRLIKMIHDGTLYFPHRDQFEDRWEGAFPDSYKHVAYEETLPHGLLRPGELDIHCSFAAISCWFESEHESIAMWKLYASGPGGVAIKTTVSRLKDALRSEVRPATFGRVRYADYDNDVFGDGFGVHPLDPLFWKGHGYVHEREMRIVIRDPHDLLAQRKDIDIRSWCAAPGPKGVHVRVDFTSLLERVVVSEHYPQWDIVALQRVLNGAGLTIDVQQSSLSRGPSVFLPKHD